MDHRNRDNQLASDVEEKPPAPLPEPRYPSPMHAEMGDFSLREFFSILFGRYKEPGE